MNEKSLFDLISKLIPDLETTEEMSFYDCYSKKHDLHIELKCRKLHYDSLIIEKIKYDKLKEFNSRYINSTPNGIYSFDIQKLEEPLWYERVLPSTTEFENNTKINKKVGYIKLVDAKDITHLFQKENEVFKKRLIKSQEAVLLVRDYFLSRGYEVEVPELVIAPTNVGAFSEYADKGDLFVEKDGKRFIIEVKHVSTNFTDKHFPYKTTIVNSYTGYNSKEPKPDFHFILSSNKEYAFYVDKETFKLCELKRIYDKYKKADLLFYVLDIDKAKFFKLNTNKNSPT
jgi:hypothetical protein